MSAILKCKVYGEDGHRLKESFNRSYSYNFSEGGNIRKITVENADITGTNLFSIITIERNTLEECEEELEGQLYDGVFENSRTGDVVRIQEAIGASL